MISSRIFEKIEKVKSLASVIKNKLSENPELQNESYVLYDRVMNPLAAQLERKLEGIMAREKVCSFMLCDLDFEPLSLSLSSMPSCDLVSLTNILILCLILKASNQSLRKNKKDERGVVVKNKSRLDAQGHRQEEVIDYDEVFAPVARIEAIRIFLAFCLLQGFKRHLWCDEFEALHEESDFQMSSMGELTFFLGLQVKQKEDVHQLRHQMAFSQRWEASDVDVHLYRSIIGSLMYLTASRPDIMFAVCACSRFQVTPKSSHLSAVKRIFRYLKGKPKLGLWYPKVSSFDLESYSDSDYAGANLDRKSTTGGCQFLGRRLISWQCKKQTIVATSTTEA
ncbi:uncharacterized mitochondrial protein-like protein [Tanacetum coccineum]